MSIVEEVSTDEQEAARSRVLKVLSESAEPVSAERILGQIPIQARPSMEVLAAILTGGGVWQYPPIRGKATFLDREPRVYAEERLRRQLMKGPARKAEVVGAVTKLKPMASLSKKELERLFLGLVDRGEVYTLRPYLGSRTPLFSLDPARPEVYVRHALTMLAKTLKVPLADMLAPALDVANAMAEELRPDGGVMGGVADDGTPSEGFRDRGALPSPVESAAHRDSDLDDVAERLLNAMPDVNPRAAEGDLVLVADLRRRLDFQVSKGLFDRAILRLAERRKISVHGFDRPQSVTDTERAELVAGERGEFYNAVSLRRGE